MQINLCLSLSSLSLLDTPSYGWLYSICLGTTSLSELTFINLLNFSIFRWFSSSFLLPLFCFLLFSLFGIWDGGTYTNGHVGQGNRNHSRNFILQDNKQYKELKLTESFQELEVKESERCYYKTRNQEIQRSHLPLVFLETHNTRVGILSKSPSILWIFLNA